MPSVSARSWVPEGRLWSTSDLSNPYGIFAQLSDAGPLHWSPDLFGGTWVVARHADAEHVLRDPHFSAQRTGGWVWADHEDAKARSELAPFQEIVARALLFVDAPDHARLRSLMHAGLTPSGLAAQRPWIENRCQQLLDAMQVKAGQTPLSAVDFMEQLARPLPASVIAHTLGLPPGDEDKVMGWSSDIAGFIGSPWPTHSTNRAAQRGLLRMTHYLQSMLDIPEQLAPHGLLARLVQGHAQGQVHSAVELLAQAAMLLFAGHETTRYLLGNMVHTLLTQPAERTGDAAQPHHRCAWHGLASLAPEQRAAAIPQVVREVLRFEPPVQYTGRRVATTHVWHGETLQRGQGVLVLLAAAGRDARRFDDPQVFNWHRRGRASLAFGTGAHVCVGAALSMMEAEITLSAMLERWPALQLAPGHACGQEAGGAPAQWLGSALYRGFEHLSLQLSPPAHGPAHAPAAASSVHSPLQKPAHAQL